MKLLIALLISIPSLLFGQATVIGKWKTIDDESGKEKSIVELFERNGLLYGKVVKIYPEPHEEQDPVCKECEKSDPRHNKKIIGMEILKNMKKAGSEYTDGDILDPENGKVYRCKIWLEGSHLMVRGYWGPFFRTQTWKKAQ